MSVRVRNLLMEQLGALRHEPIDKRIRAVLADHTVVDSTHAKTWNRPSEPAAP